MHLSTTVFPSAEKMLSALLQVVGLRACDPKSGTWTFDFGRRSRPFCTLPMFVGALPESQLSLYGKTLLQIFV